MNAERLLVSSLICGSLWLSAGFSAAQPATSPSIVDAGDQAFDRGRALYKQDKLVEAEAAFAEAWRIKKTQDIAANLGSVEFENKKYRPAAEHLAYAVRHGAPTDSDKARRTSQERLDAALKFVGVVHLRVDRDGAAVYVNNELVGRAPLEGDVYVDPGASTIEAKLEGFTDGRVEVQAAAGSSQDVSLSLPRIGRSKAPGIVLASVGVVGLALGATFIGIESSKHSDANKLATQTGHACPVSGTGGGDCAKLRSAASSADRFGNAGVGALVVGGALVAGAVAYWVWPTRSAPASSVGTLRVNPVAGPGGAGMSFSGSF